MLRLAIYKIALAAKEVGVEEERTAIVELLRANVPSMPGGPEWVDRMVGLIEERPIGGISVRYQGARNVV